MAVDEPTERLGELISRHSNRRGPLLMLVVGLGVVCLVGGPFLAVAPWAFPDPRFGTGSRIVTGLVGLGLGFVGFKMLVKLSAMRGRVVELFRGGLVRRIGEKSTVVPFDEIESIQSHRLLYRAAGGIVQTRNEAHILRLRDGTTLTVDHFLVGIGELGTRLEDQVARHVLPRVRAQLGTGARVSFGRAVELTRDGVSVKGQTAPYADLAGVAVQNGMVAFFKRGQPGAWRQVPYATVLNAKSLLALVRERTGAT